MIRFSHLKHMAQSPAHYRHAVTFERPDTASFRLGRIVDAEIYRRELVIYDGTRRGKEWEAFQAAHADDDIFTAKEVASARGVSEALMANDRAMALLRDGHHQRTMEWEWLGLRCRGTPDTWSATVLADLKTARDARPERFQREAMRYAYHAQLAWYANGLRICGYADPTDHYLVVVESAAPHPVVIHRLTDELIDDGLRLCRLWMERLKVCIESDEWPGYSQCDVEFGRREQDGDFALTIGGEEVDL